MVRKSNSLRTAKREGFKHISNWVRDDGQTKLAHLNWEERAGWLYAFVVDETVMYIGLTTGVLRSRMDNYRHFKQDQPARLREHIEVELANGKDVLLYGRQVPAGESLVVEEARLIRELDPPWNIAKPGLVPVS